MNIRYMKMTPARTYPWDDAASGTDIWMPLSIQIEFEAKEYSYSICIWNFEDIRFDSIRMKFQIRPILSEHACVRVAPPPVNVLILIFFYLR